MITLPDGTSADVIEVVNDANVITSRLKVVWPDRTSAVVFVTVSQPIDVKAGPIGLRGAETGAVIEPS